MPSPFLHGGPRRIDSMMPVLKTERLVLRPFCAEDAAALHAQLDDWEVARMVARVPHPHRMELAAGWIAQREAAWASGAQYSFCLEWNGALSGCVSLRRNDDGVSYDLGYWLGRACWRRGLASEAVQRVVEFAVTELGIQRLTAGHFRANPASGRVLEKCGFRYTGEDMQHCEARGEAVAHRCLEIVAGGAS